MTYLDAPNLQGWHLIDSNHLPSPETKCTAGCVQDFAPVGAPGNSWIFLMILMARHILNYNSDVQKKIM